MNESLNVSAAATVSVVIPCHNEGRFVAQAIASVQRQRAASNVIEIVTVDDGSTDDSHIVLTNLTSSEPRLSVLRTTGLGPAAARNLAMANCTGRYIAFLDADDFWTEDKLAVQLPVLEAMPSIALVYGDIFDFTRSDCADARIVTVRAMAASDPHSLRSYFLHDAPIYPSTAILRRSVLEHVGEFDVSYRAYEETDFFLRVLEIAAVQHVSGAYTYKRRHGCNLTRRLDVLLPAAERTTREWARRCPSLAPLARRRMARYWAKAGNDRIESGDLKAGLELLVRALKVTPFSWLLYVYLMLALTPHNAATGMRRRLKAVYHSVRTTAKRA